MPRSSRRSSASHSSAAPRGARSASTVAAPPAHAPQHHRTPATAPPQQMPSSGGSFIGNIASTAAGVAVGSTVGHGLSNMLFGGGSSEAAPVPAAPQEQSYEQRQFGGACSIQAKDFTKCLDATNNDMSACQYYLDQLKACQQMASQY